MINNTVGKSNKHSKVRNDFNTQIQKSSELSSHDRLLALMLSMHMNNETGRCYPSRKTLSEETAMSLASISRSIKSLTDKGFIRVKRELFNKQYHNLYELIVVEGVLSERAHPIEIEEGGVLRVRTGVFSERYTNPVNKPSKKKLTEHSPLSTTDPSEIVIDEEDNDWIYKDPIRPNEQDKTSNQNNPMVGEDIWELLKQRRLQPSPETKL